MTTALVLSANPERHVGRKQVAIESVKCSKCGQPATLQDDKCRNCNLTDPIKMTAEPFPMKVLFIFAVAVAVLITGFWASVRF